MKPLFCPPSPPCSLLRMQKLPRCFSFLKFVLFAWNGRGGQSTGGKRFPLISSPSNPRNRIKSATAILKFCFERETWQCLFSRVSATIWKKFTKKLRGNERGELTRERGGTKKDRGCWFAFERGDGKKKQSHRCHGCDNWKLRAVVDVIRLKYKLVN